MDIRIRISKAIKLAGQYADKKNRLDQLNQERIGLINLRPVFSGLPEDVDRQLQKITANDDRIGEIESEQAEIILWMHEQEVNDLGTLCWFLWGDPEDDDLIAVEANGYRFDVSGGELSVNPVVNEPLIKTVDTSLLKEAEDVYLAFFGKNNHTPTDLINLAHALVMDKQLKDIAGCIAHCAPI